MIYDVIIPTIFTLGNRILSFYINLHSDLYKGIINHLCYLNLIKLLRLYTCYKAPKPSNLTLGVSFVTPVNCFYNK